MSKRLNENPYQAQEIAEPELSFPDTDSSSDLKSGICVALALIVILGMVALAWYNSSLPLAQRNTTWPFLVALVVADLGLVFVALHDGYKTRAHAPRSILRGLIVPWMLHVVWVLYYFLVKRPSHFRKRFPTGPPG